MGVIVIALKNVKACTVLTESQKRKRKIVEQKCQHKHQHKIGGKILELFLEMNVELIGRQKKIKDR